MRLIGELYRPTVGLLGCTVPRELLDRVPGPGRFLTGEMDADEAARTAEMLGLELAVACHYLEPDEEVERFLRARSRVRHDRAPAGRGAARRRDARRRRRPSRGRGQDGLRLVSFSAAGKSGVGARRGGEIVDDRLRRHARADPRRRRAGSSAPASATEGGEPVEAARLHAPLRPGKILCSGVNYASHKDENPDATMPEEPFFFSKLPSAVVGPGAPIVIPRETTQTDYEVELALVVGRTARRVREERRARARLRLDRAATTSAPVTSSSRTRRSRSARTPTPSRRSGPEIVTADELGDPSALARLDDAQRRDDAGRSHVRDAVRARRACSSSSRDLITLEPGDVVTTGTPAGVGCFRDSARVPPARRRDHRLGRPDRQADEPGRGRLVSRTAGA